MPRVRTEVIFRGAELPLPLRPDHVDESAWYSARGSLLFRGDEQAAERRGWAMPAGVSITVNVLNTEPAASDARPARHACAARTPDPDEEPATSPRQVYCRPWLLNLDTRRCCRLGGGENACFGLRPTQCQVLETLLRAGRGAVVSVYDFYANLWPLSRDLLPGGSPRRLRAEISGLRKLFRQIGYDGVICMTRNLNGYYIAR